MKKYKSFKQMQEEIGIKLIQYRNKNNMTQKAMQKKMDFKHLYSYQRLEKGCDIKLSTMVKIKKIIPDISFDEILEQK